MFNGFRGKGFSKRVSEPTEHEDKSKLSLVLYSKKWLQDITERCIDAAGSSEFQIGYRALVARMTKGDVQFIVTIPTATYNFPQKVSGSRVEYELSDIEANGKAVSEESMVQVQYLLDSMPILGHLRTIAETQGFKYELFESNCGSIHRHPGDFGFSQTDYDKDPEEPGVIFRMGNTENHPQTDSVLFIKHDGETKIVVTETRIVNVKPAEDGGIVGSYAEIPTIQLVVNDYEQEDILEDLLGDLENKPDQTAVILKTLGAQHSRPIIRAVMNEYQSIAYTPPITGILATNIEQKVYSHTKYVQSNHSQTKTIHGGKTGTKQKEQKAINHKDTPSTPISKEDAKWSAYYESLSPTDQIVADSWLETYVDNDPYTEDEQEEWSEYIKEMIMSQGV